MGEYFVIACLAGVVALAIRSLWRTHKAGGHCNGNCGECGGCHKS